VARQSRVRVLCQERGGCRRRRGPPPCPQKSRTGVAERKEVPGGRVKDYSSGEGMFPVVTWKISVPTEERTWHD
jgi:hypothetical protein